MVEPLHFETFGRRTGEPVVFLHGFMGSSIDWRKVVEILEGDFYCVCVDLPGHGRSIGFYGRDAYTMPGTSRLLLHMLDGEGLKDAHVVGYSMGGRVALHFAVHHPDRCRRLILESASPGLEHEQARRERRQIDEARARRLENGDLAEFLEEWYRQPLFATYQDHPDLLRRMIESRRANDPLELARSLRGMGTGEQPSVWERLGDMEIHALAIVGELDARFVETAERMAARMPNLQTSIVPNAGHNVHAEHPTAYAEIIRDYLTKPI